MNVHIVTVIPLSTSLPKDSLEYFSTKEIFLGDIVEIPIRKQTHKAIVTEIKDVKNQKSILKDANFQLKAIKKIIGPSPFDSSFLKTLEGLKQYYVGGMSQIFSESISQIILDNLKKLSLVESQTQKKEFKTEKLILQQPWSERVSFYKALVRESFAKGESVRFIAPTIQDVESIFETLAKGIQDYCFIFHSKQTPKQVINSWNGVAASKHPVCIIQTPQFLCVPRQDTGVIVLEKENSHHYQSNRRPYIDGRILTELFTRVSNIKYIMSDTLLRTETLMRHQNQELGAINNLFFRINSSCEHKVIDMRKEELAYKFLSKEVLESISEAYKEKKKILLFTLRPGLATIIVCNDCGTTQTYKGTPLTLHTNPATGERFFKSKKYNEEFRTNIVCSNCNGWNLRALGVGTETIEELLKEKGFNVSRIDQNHNHTIKQIKEMISSFEENEQGSILISTQLGIPYLTKEVDISCIVSLDSLFNIPQFNMYEKITHIIMDISTKTKNTCFIQTRFADQKITSILQSKKLFDFFEYDMEERKFWEYPPFTTIIKMTYEGPTKEIPILEKYIKKVFDEYEYYSYHTRGKSDSKTLTSIILKIPEHTWFLPWVTSKSKEKMDILRQKLEHFPPSWSISINPQNIL